MKRWPVVDPPPHGPLHTNLRGTLVDAPVFDGPLNVLIELHGTALAANDLTETKNAYNDLHPTTPDPVVTPPPAPPINKVPIGTRVAVEQLVDPGIAKRVKHRPYHLVTAIKNTITSVIKGEP